MLECLDAEREDLLRLLTDLVRVPSVTGSDAEHEAQALLAAEMDSFGLDVDHWPIDLEGLSRDPAFPGSEAPRTQAWGLVGRLPGGAGGGEVAGLLLDGHVDVVPPGDPDAWTGDPWSGRVDAGYVHGRGSCDMKAGLVAALAAARAVRAAGVPLRADLLVASVVGEEDGGLGTFATLRRGWTAQACVVPEPTALQLVPASAGALTFRLRLRGRATHASRRSEGVSAVEKFLAVFGALRDLEARRNATVDPLMARWPIAYPLEIGVVRAGDWPSSVPDLLVAEGRLGVALDEPVAAARADLEQAVAAACAADPWLADNPIEVQWWGGQFASGRLPPDSDLLAAAARAHAAVSDAPQEVYGGPYGSDLRLLVGIGGIPTLHYGPGDSVLAHAPDERVPVAEVLTAARALAVLAVDRCGPAAAQSPAVPSR